MFTCDVCRNDYVPEGNQSWHSECTCPVCGGVCASFRSSPNQLVFEIQHTFNTQTVCVPRYRISRDMLITRREHLPQFRETLQDCLRNDGNSVPIITPGRVDC
jgi:hypothetical protein